MSPLVSTPYHDVWSNTNDLGLGAFELQNGWIFRRNFFSMITVSIAAWSALHKKKYGWGSSECSCQEVETWLWYYERICANHLLEISYQAPILYKYDQMHKNVETFTTVFGGAGVAAGVRCWTLCSLPLYIDGYKRSNQLVTALHDLTRTSGDLNSSILV